MLPKLMVSFSAAHTEKPQFSELLSENTGKGSEIWNIIRLEMGPKPQRQTHSTL